MKRALLAAVLGAALAAPAAAFAALPASVVANPARAADVKNDARRKGPELAAFAEVKPGQRVYDLIPGGGYFTRLFSLAVGPSGKVYAVWPDEYDKVSKPDSDVMRKMAAAAPFTNVRVLTQPARAFAAPEPLDLVFTSQNYHDYPDKFMGKVDPVVLDRQVYKVLKPGGLYIVLDHSAAAGSGLRDTNTLHRIDAATVKAEVTAAGFKFAGESKVLANPADDRTKKVFDPAIRGHTDQFIYKFRKPG